jgi:hypothetical protein
MGCRSLGVLLLVVSLGGCKRTTEPGLVVCDLNAVPGIVVDIYDAVSGVPVADSASGTVVDGTYSDSLRPHAFDSSSMVLVARAAAYERAGTYLVSVQRAGYQQWTRSAVQVTKNVCHVNTVTLQADMNRAP